MTDELRSRYHGTFLGLAIGDALGWPVEFLSLHQIRQLWGPHGITDLVEDQHFLIGTFTDDTQMTIALAEGLLASPYDDAEAQMVTIAKRFVAWSTSPENNRAPGNTCMTACRNLADGATWRTSCVTGSKGCGTTMRSAPLGLLYHRDFERLVDRAVKASRITHGHPCALAGGVATAAAVSLALDHTPPTELVLRVAGLVEPVSAAAAAHIRRVLDVAELPADEAMAKLGEGWVAEEAAALALSSFLAHPDDYEATIRRAVNTEGDSDSIGCIAGAISGAYNGEEAIPARWRKVIEKREHLLYLANALYDGWRTAQGTMTRSSSQ